MRILSGCLLLLCAALSARGSFIDYLLPKHDVEVITNSEITSDGAMLKPVSPQSPVYFMAVNIGYKDFGGMIAGDKVPADKDMVKMIFKVLAKQGYLPATQNHPPTQLIMFFYGTMYVNKMPSMNTELPDVQLNYYQMLKFIGGDKMGLIPDSPMMNDVFPSMGSLSFVGYDARTLQETARDDLYVAALASYDFQSLYTKNRKLLWKTRIACPSRGLVMSETLPAMLVIAGPNIGKDLKRPVWVRAEERFKAEVKVGDPVYEGFIEAGNLPVIDGKGMKADLSGASKGKKK